MFVQWIYIPCERKKNVRWSLSDQLINVNRQCLWAEGERLEEDVHDTEACGNDTEALCSASGHRCWEPHRNTESGSLEGRAQGYAVAIPCPQTPQDIYPQSRLGIIPTKVSFLEQAWVWCFLAMWRDNECWLTDGLNEWIHQRLGRTWVFNDNCSLAAPLTPLHSSLNFFPSAPRSLAAIQSRRRGKEEQGEDEQKMTIEVASRDGWGSV